jgi:hypothetical protein
MVRGGGGRQQALGLGQRRAKEKIKINDSDYNVRERCAIEN